MKNERIEKIDTVFSVLMGIFSLFLIWFGIIKNYIITIYGILLFSLVMIHITWKLVTENANKQN